MTKFNTTKFYYTENSVICIVTDPTSGQKFIGEAKCHPNDSYNKRIGEQIAEMRAETEIYRFLREAARVEENHFRITITDMKQSKKYNPKSYEAKNIRRAYWEAKTARKEFNTMVQAMKSNIKKYIAVRCK